MQSVYSIALADWARKWRKSQNLMSGSNGECYSRTIQCFTKTADQRWSKLFIQKSRELIIIRQDSSRDICTLTSYLYPLIPESFLFSNNWESQTSMAFNVLWILLLNKDKRYEMEFCIGIWKQFHIKRNDGTIYNKQTKYIINKQKNTTNNTHQKTNKNKKQNKNKNIPP